MWQSCKNNWKLSLSRVLDTNFLSGEVGVTRVFQFGHCDDASWTTIIFLRRQKHNNIVFSLFFSCPGNFSAFNGVWEQHPRRCQGGANVLSVKQIIWLVWLAVYEVRNPSLTSYFTGDNIDGSCVVCWQSYKRTHLFYLFIHLFLIYT